MLRCSFFPNNCFFDPGVMAQTREIILPCCSKPVLSCFANCEEPQAHTLIITPPTSYYKEMLDSAKVP